MMGAGGGAGGASYSSKELLRGILHSVVHFYRVSEFNQIMQPTRNIFNDNPKNLFNFYYMLTILFDGSITCPFLVFNTSRDKATRRVHKSNRELLNEVDTVNCWTEVLYRKMIPSSVYHKSHKEWPRIEPGTATNRLSHCAASTVLILKLLGSKQIGIYIVGLQQFHVIVLVSEEWRLMNGGTSRCENIGPSHVGMLL